MYRVSPFTYLISGMLSTAIANTNVVCADNEYLKFNTLENTSCAQYLSNYIRTAGGYLQNPESVDTCSFCPQSSTNIFLASVSANFDEAWRNFGIMWAYILFNVAAALLIYWLVRVPKNQKVKKE
jgi:ATP-binding cassette, subfamily G (WHITE), member 2, PDR